MKIVVQCPSCGQRIELAIAQLDRRKLCQVCGVLFKIPDAKQLEKAIEIAQNAGGTIYVDENGRIYG